MLAHIPSALLATCLAFGTQEPADPAAWAAGEPSTQGPQAPPAIDTRVAEVLAAARERGADGAQELAGQLRALGDGAAPALLDAYVFGRVVRDPLQPELDLTLGEDERKAVGAAIARLDHAVLLGLAYEALVRPSAALRTRGLAALELVGDVEQLDLALSVAGTAAPGGTEVHAAQAELERAVAAVARRDKRALGRLRELLQSAPDWIALALVRGCASAGGAEAVLALSDELDRAPQHEALLLSELARAARTAPLPLDPRVSVEVVERLRSTDPAIARAAVAAAGSLEEPEAVPVLVALLDAPSAGMREAALSALQQISRCTYGPASSTWTAWLERERAWHEQRGADLERQIASLEPGRVLTALREIAAHKLRRHELAALAARALEHPSAEVRRTACATLAALGSRASASRLTERLGDEDPQVARAARDGLASLTPRSQASATPR